jgi:methylenetetrahydrofolate dehydrogenase (NADP+)/methenyltetrahydrofolate cyclohydrolase
LSHKGPLGDATVTLAHSRSRDLGALGRAADLIVAAIGRPAFVGPDWVRPGAVVIDVGINRVSDPSAPGGSRLVGDVDFAQVAPIAGAITPVPGGVGPMTVAALIHNTLFAAEQAAS